MGCRIALSTGLTPATVSRILQRKETSRLRDLDPVSPVVRYEHACPGDLLHLDIKKLGRFGCVGHRIRNGGWEYVHVAIDDHSRSFLASGGQRKRSFCGDFSESSAGLVCQTRHGRAPLAHRQRALLQIPSVSRGLPAARNQTHSHTTLRAAHQRESRAVHSNRSPRVGLRLRLQHLEGTRGAPSALAP